METKTYPNNKNQQLSDIDLDLLAEAKAHLKKDYDLLKPFIRDDNIEFSLSIAGEDNSIYCLDFCIGWWYHKIINTNFLPKSSEKTLLIIYFHGIGCSKYDFAQVINYMNLPGVEIIGFDWPGSGDSKFSPSDNFSTFDVFLFFGYSCCCSSWVYK